MNTGIRNRFSLLYYVRNKVQSPICQLGKEPFFQMALRLASEVPKFQSGTEKPISVFSIQKYLKEYIAIYKNINFRKKLSGWIEKFAALGRTSKSICT